MKLRNKKTGEIVDDGYVRETHDFQFDGQKFVLAVFKGNGHRPPERVSGAYKSLAELNEEWEDYEEPKKHYEILAMGAVMEREDAEDEIFRNQGQREIGNYFETEKEAQLAVEKLKAWKRLKDKGFRFKMWEWEYIYDDNISGELTIKAHIDDATDSDGKYTKDLDLLFGGEE